VRIGPGQVTADTFASVVGVIGGGAVVSLPKDELGGTATLVVPIGLVAGIVLHVVAGV
jgi:hypothetical protein